jgi:predicted nucleic acid-binding protein
LTDLTRFVVMRELGLQQALTAHAHFEQVGMRFFRLP